MPVNVATVYTKERLLRFNDAVAASKKAVWITMAICTFIVFGCYILLELWDADASTVIFCCFLAVFMDLTSVASSFLIPRLTIKKQAALNAVLNYSFEEDCFKIQATSAYENSAATVQYAILHKVMKKGNDLYLFVSNRQAHLVDLSALSEEQVFLLKSILEEKVDLRKVKWAN